ncbi:hypothetical protein Cci01nite_16480 [Catellatospora citrea]|uniref:DUF11 domain-containing protein n=2 Tax=Catellatospora citrea TaxID=53366 RepID=A0A8J3K9E2_9ACTN|nr:hypothetical protein Cci01nite_16480 [Catellatospora citrea]
MVGALLCGLVAAGWGAVPAYAAESADIRVSDTRAVGSVGQTVKVTITVSNRGPDPSYRPTVFVHSAPGLAFVGFASCPGELNDGGCMLPTLQAGAAQSAVANIKITGKDPSGSYGVRTSTPDPNTSNADILHICVIGGWCTNGKRYDPQPTQATSPRPRPKPSRTAASPAAPKPSPTAVASPTAEPSPSPVAVASSAVPSPEPSQPVDTVPVSAEPVNGSSNTPAVAAFALVLALIVGASAALWRRSR